MDFDVTIDRDKYIGGSDIPVIMGISPFKTRWELLQEKAGLKESEFKGNKYTEYGNIIEPQIRDYVNRLYQTFFEPTRIINGDFRYHSDGFDGECVLEIKSTSNTHDTVDEYKIYLVQLLKGMEENKVNKGILAVYQRPDDFDTEFDPKLLQIFMIDIKEYTILLKEINAELDKFRADRERLRNNPLLSEQDFQPTELIVISKQVVEIENRIAELKALEAEQKKVKQTLFEAMTKYDVKSWETPGGIKITRVDAIPTTEETVTVFDEDTFKEENAGLYAMYQKDVVKKKSGKSGYVKITMPKG